MQGMFTNALADDEMLVEVRVRVPSSRAGGAYLKLERKVGDYATVAVAAQLDLDDAGTIARAGLALTSVNPSNTKVADAEAVLVGQAPSDELFAEAGELAAAAADPRSDVRGAADWKRQVVRIYTRRALASAARQAQELRSQCRSPSPSTARLTPTTSSRACCSSTTSVGSSSSPAPTSAATRRVAGPARCCSTVGR